MTRRQAGAGLLGLLVGLGGLLVGTGGHPAAPPRFVWAAGAGRGVAPAVAVAAAVPAPVRTALPDVIRNPQSAIRNPQSRRPAAHRRPHGGPPARPPAQHQRRDH